MSDSRAVVLKGSLFRSHGRVGCPQYPPNRHGVVRACTCDGEARTSTFPPRTTSMGIPSGVSTRRFHPCALSIPPGECRLASLSCSDRWPIKALSLSWKAQKEAGTLRDSLNRRSCDNKTTTQVGLDNMPHTNTWCIYVYTTSYNVLYIECVYCILNVVD